MILNIDESKLTDLGVRKYDYDLGRFLSIDKLWENYYGWTPYQYSMNNPISFLDGNGLYTDKKPKDGHADQKKIDKVERTAKVKPDFGEETTVEIGKMNCFGFALMYCNGKGYQEFNDKDKSDQTKNNVIGYSTPIEQAKSDGYKEKGTVNVSNDNAKFNDVKKNDMLFYYDHGKVVHASIVTGIDKNGNLEVGQVQYDGDPISKKLTLQESIKGCRDRKVGLNNEITIIQVWRK